MTVEIGLADLETEIEAAWENREALSPDTRGPARTAVVEHLAARKRRASASTAARFDAALIVLPWPYFSGFFAAARRRRSWMNFQLKRRAQVLFAS